MSSSYHHPCLVEMDSDLQHRVQLDQNLDQKSLINLINLDSSDSSSIAHFNNLHPPFQLPSSIGVLDYHQPSSLDSIPIDQNDTLALFNNLEYSLELDNPLHSTIPSATPSSCAPPSSPSWSPLDQLLFPVPPLTQHPQSSPLFPCDLVPNWQESTGDSIREPESNLIDFSTALDSQLEYWSLIFDSIQPNQESNNYELSQFFHPSGSKDGENYQQAALPGLQLGSVRPTTECLEEFNFNRSTMESEAVENNLYPIHPDATDFASPLSTNSYNHALSMKRKRSTNSPISMTEPDPFPFDSVRMQFINSSIGQQEEANKENINSEPIESNTKNKRPKTSASRSTSKAKIHVCTECGKSFPRLTSLTQHKLTHNGERPYRCSFEGCTKSFTTSSNSKRHWRTHF